MDAAFAGLLTIAAKRSTRARWPGYRAHGMLPVVGGFVLLLAAVWAHGALPRLAVRDSTSPGISLHANNTVVLDPQRWVGTAWPLANLAPETAYLAQGDWRVLFFHHGCSRCQQQLRALGAAGKSNWALVEVPPFGTTPASITHAKRTPLPGHRNWFVETPLTLTIRGGLITSATGDTMVRRSARDAAQDVPVQSTTGSPFPDYREARRRRYLESVGCGPLALIAVSEELGRKVSPAEHDRLLQLARKGATSLAELKEAAESLGLHSPGVRAPIDELARIGKPAIVHLDGSVFAAVYEYGRGDVALKVALSPERRVSFDQLESRRGEMPVCLLVDREPFDSFDGVDAAEPPAADGLVPTETMIALGRLRKTKWSGILELVNKGSKPVAVKKVTTSCGCVEAKVDPLTIEAGATAMLSVAGETSQPGPVSQQAVIFLEEGSPLLIPIRGTLEPPLEFGAPGISFGRVPLRASHIREVQFFTDGDDRLSGLAWRVTPDDGRLTATSSTTRAGGTLSLSWYSADASGAYVYDVQAEIDGVDAPAHLSVFVEVEPQLKCEPPSLRFAFGEPEAKPMRRVVVRSLTALTEPPQIVMPLALTSALSTTWQRHDDRSFVAEIRARDLGSLRPLRGTVHPVAVDAGDHQAVLDIGISGF